MCRHSKISFKGIHDMVIAAGSGMEQLRAYAENLAIEDLELLVDDLRAHVEEHALDVTEAQLGAVAAEIAVEIQAGYLVKCGYADSDEIAELMSEMVELAEVEYSDADIDRIVDDLWMAQVERQRSWPEVTDNERMERAFTRLRQTGIVAAENFTCCQRCGISEIGGEIPDGETMDGYTFFHKQDTESALSGGVLFLSYSTFGAEPVRASAVEIGSRVVAALNAQGLRTKWSGSSDERIQVLLTWQRRLRPMLA